MIRTAAPKVGWVGSRRRTLAFCLLAVLVAASIGLLLRADPAHAQFFVVFTVNSTADQQDANAGDNSCDVDTSTPGDQCTLRAAIEEVNANGTTVTDFVDFNIPGSGVKTISPRTSLPIITEPVIIDGYTQRPCSTNPAPCSKPNTSAVGTNAVLLIRLDGNNVVDTGGLRIIANDSVVRGLSITRFSHHEGIVLYGADNTSIEGNFIGTSPGGTQTDLGNGRGLSLEINFSVLNDTSSNNTVGGTSLEDRNLISGNLSEGVFITSGESNKVKGNYIGTTKSGTADLGNGSSGILIAVDETNNTIGGNGAARNTIAFNAGDGVQIGANSSEAGVTGNSMLVNSIFSNSGLGIDLGGDGRTLNDAGDADTGPNNLQNFPIIRSAETVGNTTTIVASLNSTPSTQFVVRFYSNPSTENEGKRFIGSKSVTTNASGNTGNFTFSPAKSVTVGQRITATATNDSGNTSEFSVQKNVLG